MNLGQLLGGAGDVARAQRVEQEARNLERMRQQEFEDRLRTSELNRRNVEQTMTQRGELHPLTVEQQRLLNQDRLEAMRQRGELHPLTVEQQRLLNQDRLEAMRQRGELFPTQLSQAQAAYAASLQQLEQNAQLFPSTLTSQELANQQTAQAIAQGKETFQVNLAQSQAVLAQTLQAIKQQERINPLLIQEATARLTQIEQAIQQSGAKFPVELAAAQATLADALNKLNRNIQLQPLEIQKLQTELANALQILEQNRQTFEVNLGTALTENQLNYLRLQEAQTLANQQAALREGVAGIAIPEAMTFSRGDALPMYQVPPPPVPTAPAGTAEAAAAAPPPAPPAAAYQPANPLVRRADETPNQFNRRLNTYKNEVTGFIREIDSYVNTTLRGLIGGQNRLSDNDFVALGYKSREEALAYLKAFESNRENIQKYLEERPDYLGRMSTAIPEGGQERYTYSHTIIRSLVDGLLAMPGAAAAAAGAPAAAPAAAPAPGAAPGAAPAAAPGAAPGAAAPGAAAGAVPAAGLRPAFTQEDFYLAGGMNAAPANIQRATADRQQLVNLAEVYRQAGMTNEYMSTVAEITNINNQITYLQGMQGIQEMTIASDPRLLASVWSAYAGTPIGIQPRSDGLYNVYVNGQRRGTDGVSRDEIIDAARSSFDQSYVEQKSTMAERIAEAQLEANVQIAIEEAKGNQARLTEILKERFNYGITARDDVIIIKPPFGKPMAFNPKGQDRKIGNTTVTAYGVVPIADIPELEE